MLAHLRIKCSETKGLNAPELLLRKRAVILTVFISVSFLILTARVFYLQLISGGKLAEEASVQRAAASEIDSLRGNILDRNGIPLTNRSKKYIIALKPLLLKGKTDELEKISNILKINLNELRRQVEVKREPIQIETDEDKKNRLLNLNINGITVINSLNRYDYNSIARHLLGYIKKADQVGETGIEKAYEDVLKADGENSIGVVTDARYNIVEGIGYRLVTTQDKGSNVKLTIDYSIQRIVDDILEEHRITGAVVVEDVNTGNIVAMASKPDFDQNDVSKFLENSNNALFNRAVASYDMGSLFKIIDVAKYLEMGMSEDQEYFCPGYIKFGDKELKCSSYERGGHGLVDLKQAFALSCNTYFANIAIKMGAVNLIDMAKRFGFGSPVGIEKQGIPESSGNLPEVSKYTTYGNTANFSIGQGDIMVTPVQAADMIATVANGGIKNKVNIVDSIVDNNLNSIKIIRLDEGKRIISKEVADKIKLLMEEVTATGTGKKANLDAYGGTAGKTGTAETGQYDNGKKVVHGWFGGYFPKKQPKYSMVVFIEGGQDGGAAAAIFGEIAREILK